MERDIDGNLAALEESIIQDYEKVGVKAALTLVGIFLKTLVRIVDAMEAKNG